MRLDRFSFIQVALTTNDVAPRRGPASVIVAGTGRPPFAAAWTFAALMLGWGAAEAQVVTPTFRKKIANNSNYSVTLWNVSIMIDPRGADVTLDRRDTDKGKVI